MEQDKCNVMNNVMQFANKNNVITGNANANDNDNDDDTDNDGAFYSFHAKNN